MRRKIAAGNWKMNGTRADLDELQSLVETHGNADVKIVLCPSALLLFPACKIAEKSTIAIGAQDCHTAVSGAHTGDISAQMIADTGAAYVIVGHSERREAHDENDNDVRNKAQVVRAAGLVAILCIGESLKDRNAHKTLNID